MSRACRGHVVTCRAASCDVTQRRKVSTHRPTPLGHSSSTLKMLRDLQLDDSSIKCLRPPY
eukprot:1628079-Prymnesium_polylepis.1